MICPRCGGELDSLCCAACGLRLKEDEIVCAGAPAHQNLSALAGYIREEDGARRVREQQKAREEERRRKAAEAEKLQKLQEAAQKRWAAAEELKRRQEEEKKRLQAIRAERQRREAAEALKRRQEEEEKRLQAIRAERQRREAAEAEERRRKAEKERRDILQQMRESARSAAQERAAIVARAAAAEEERWRRERQREQEESRERREKQSTRRLAAGIAALAAAVLLFLLYPYIKNAWKTYWGTLSPGDSISFGQYEQDGDTVNGAERLTWTVLDVSEGRALLLCDVCVDARPYNSSGGGSAWEDSTLRQWLNSDFLFSAFSAKEQQVIPETEVTTTQLLLTEEGQVTAGEETVTVDRVFLPDSYRMWYSTAYGAMVPAGKFELTDYVAEKFETLNRDANWIDEFSPAFWTRGPVGEDHAFALGWDREDETASNWYSMFLDSCMLVRPAMYIDTDAYRTFLRDGAEENRYTADIQVRQADGEDKSWQANVEAQVGDVVEFQFTYVNTGEEQQTAVFRDVLPENLAYVPGSTVAYNSLYPDGINLEDGPLLSDAGVNLGKYNAGANAYVRFSAQVVDVSLSEGSNTLVNWGRVSVGETLRENYAAVVVYRGEKN